MDIPHGPRAILAKGQVTLPKELLDKVELAVGDQVYVALNPDVAGTLVLVPALMLERVFPDVIELLRQQRKRPGK